MTDLGTPRSGGASGKSVASDTMPGMTLTENIFVDGATDKVRVLYNGEESMDHKHSYQ